MTHKKRNNSHDSNDTGGMSVRRYDATRWVVMKGCEIITIGTFEECQQYLGRGTTRQEVVGRG
jgi:hypothetical protein